MKPVLLLNAALLGLFFAAWCVVDYSLVNSPRFPQNSHDADWAFILIPLVTGAANLVAQRKQRARTSLLTANVATVAVCTIFLVMLVVLGMPFHLSIGGTL